MSDKRTISFGTGKGPGNMKVRKRIKSGKRTVPVTRFAALAAAFLAAGVSGCGMGANAAKVSSTSAVSEMIEVESVSAEEEEENFSCVGGWESDNHLVYIFDEDGNAEHIINKIKGKGEKQKVTPSKKVSYIWEEDSENIYLTLDKPVDDINYFERTRDFHGMGTLALKLLIDPKKKLNKKF